MLYVLIILGLVIALGLFAALAYNRLVAMRERVKSAWSQIDVFLKRRHDLIPNLVETVKGYATHEKDTLTNVIAARNAAVAAPDLKSSVKAEGQLSGSLRQLFAVAESYPDLKANANFSQLQRELAGTEDEIAARRSGYNEAVRSYNTAVMSFPNNLFAGAMGFAAEPFFEVQDPGQREAPAVKF